jgi:D-tyrosyl-tRNA(Tyr) deacylase
MRAVIQRVKSAAVSVNDDITGEIAAGLLIFVGIEDADTEEDIEWLSNKLINLRIFNDAAGVMNVSVMDAGGNLLVVSQFTLHASTKKGNRPSYIKAAKPGIAVPLYQRFLERLSQLTGRKIATGVFGADMQVELVNDGPVTILMDTKNKE